MDINPNLFEKARAAGLRLAQAERQVGTARAEYHNLVRRLHLAGGSLREIAAELGLSHQRVQQMVGSAGGSWWSRVWSSRNRKRNLACSFCKRPEPEVARLIAGPNVFICGECISSVDESRTRCSFCDKSKSGARAHICRACLSVCRQILLDCTPRT